MPMLNINGCSKDSEIKINERLKEVYGKCCSCMAKQIAVTNLFATTETFRFFYRNIPSLIYKYDQSETLRNNKINRHDTFLDDEVPAKSFLFTITFHSNKTNTFKRCQCVHYKRLSKTFLTWSR